jgi:hypothetical protein
MFPEMAIIAATTPILHLLQLFSSLMLVLQQFIAKFHIPFRTVPPQFHTIPDLTTMVDQNIHSDQIIQLGLIISRGQTINRGRTVNLVQSMVQGQNTTLELNIHQDLIK